MFRKQMMCPFAVFLNHRIQNIVLEQGYEIEMSLNVMMSFAFQVHFLHFYDLNFIKLIMINLLTFDFLSFADNNYEYL